MHTTQLDHTAEPVCPESCRPPSDGLRRMLLSASASGDRVVGAGRGSGELRGEPAWTEVMVRTFAAMEWVGLAGGGLASPEIAKTGSGDGDGESSDHTR